MDERGKKTSSGEQLRRSAEARLGTESVDVETLSLDEIRRLVHELQTHQIELELQNEQLRTTEAELACARDRYLDLYELAPVGYLTLHDGKIQELNLTAATLFGVERAKLVGAGLAALVEPGDAEKLHGHLRDVIASDCWQSAELRFRRPSGTFHGQLDSIPARAEGPAVVRSALSDVTDRKEAERQLEIRIEELRQANDDLSRFNRVAVDRELRMIELKREVNALCAELGRPRRYPLAFEEET